MRILRNHWLVLCLSVVLLLTAAVRIRLLSIPLERDEGEYAYAGQLMLEGVPPYKLLYNMKMPGIYAAYAAILAAFGQTPSAIHLGLLFLNLGAIALVFLLAKKLFGARGALAACVTYALLSTSTKVLGFAAHATEFVVVAALGGTLLLLRAMERDRRAEYFCGGGLFGLAFLLKQPGGAFGLFGLSVLLWAAFRRRPSTLKADAVRICFFTAGVLAPIFFTALLLWHLGVFERFWFWTVTYAGIHAKNQSLSFGASNLGTYFRLLKWDALLWVVAAMGLPCLLRSKMGADARFFFLSLLAFSAASTCPTFYFSAHYFVLTLPVVSLFAGLALNAAFELTESTSGTAFRPAVWVFTVASFAAVIYAHRAEYFELTPTQVCIEQYFRNAFEVYPAVGAQLQERSPPNATLAVIGSEPELMFYARRRSVTGYIYMYDLVQDQPYREKMEQEMKEEVERGRPDFLVFVSVKFSWLTSDADAARSIFNWMKDYTERYYEPFGVVATGSQSPIWGANCLQMVSPTDRFMVLFKRK